MREDPLLDHEEPVPPGVAHPSPLMLGGGLIALAIIAALAAGALVTRHPFGFDRAIILALHEAGPMWLRHAVIDVTALGGVTVLAFVVAATTGLLLVRRLWLTAALVVAATTIGSLVVDVLKTIFSRPRPEIVDHIVAANGYSFPSGHAANSAIVYLTIAALVSQVTRGHATRLYIALIAGTLVAAIGLSRVYLGVHWPSDVLAGWSFGTLWALGCWSIGAKARMRLIHQRE
ncbi:phosphatase PAP2 family protein [uncultured Sphingomonas sp.]|uniref:phosphatase PAP2 family protein n=1 Tax=uncultured Sphingomonas sp. TaxID=158754 RepID=UPI002638A092|nr:phosphatase PAP2 family protein [uncultured Sphingomonas sp.]